MDAAEAMVLEVLQCAGVGADSAITGRAIADTLGMSLRAVQASIDGLIKDHHQPIASSTDGRMGYHLCVTEAERQRYLTQLCHRMRELALRSEAIASCRLYQPATDLVDLMAG
jgi:biotin operon repressor